MKKPLIHPPWTHVVAISTLAALVVSLLKAGPLPGQAPIDFAMDGSPKSYGPPWMVFGLAVGLSAFYIVISFFWDELWARREKAKTFNWLALCDEFVVGGLSGMSAGYLKFLKAGSDTFQFPWTEAMLGMFGTMALAMALEIVRPYREMPHRVEAEDTSALRAEISQRLRTNGTFVYWEAQNPPYVTFLATSTAAALFAGASITWFSSPAVAIFLFLFGIVFILFNGGQRTIITRQDVYVKYGLPGLNVLHLNTSEIAAAELHNFAPLKDFGGYGIRSNSEMKAYFLSGTQGVKLTTASGKKYLIGSDQPERLAIVIRSVLRTAT